MKSIIEYTDYRTYLREYIEEQRGAGINVTNRFFASQIGINSSSWLTDVLAGKKGLSKTTANKISKMCGHSRRERSYFENLVFFNQARTVEDRNEYYQHMVSLQRQCTPTVVGKDQYQYYSQWYHSTVRSLCGIIKVSNDNIKELAQSIIPPITVAQATESLELLVRLGIVIMDTDGIYQIVSRAITSGDQTGTLAVANFQQETMRLGIESLDRHAREVRDISTMTVAISAPSFEKIRGEIATLRKKIAEIANSDLSSDSVYQFNCQWFPVSMKRLTEKSRL